MANVTYCDLPMCECPHCEKEWQEDDYYELSAGDELECPNCEKAIHVRSVDVTISATLSTEAED